MRTATAGGAGARPTGHGKGVHIDLKVPKDSEIPLVSTYDRNEQLLQNGRNRLTRTVSALLTGAATLGIPVWISEYFLGSFLGVPVGLVLGGLALRFIIPHLVVSVPEWSGFVTEDFFTGTMRPYGPGTHPSHLWERRKQERNYSLKAITAKTEVEVQASDGTVIAHIAYSYKVSLKRMTQFAGVSFSTVEHGFNSFFEEFLTFHLSKMTVEQARQSTRAVNTELAHEFQGERPDDVRDLEQKYGIDIVSIVIENFALPPGTKDARAGVDKAKQIFPVVAELLGTTVEQLKAKMASGDIKPEELKQHIENAMAITKTAEMSVFRVSSGDLGGMIGSLFNSVKKKGGPRRGGT